MAPAKLAGFSSLVVVLLIGCGVVRRGVTVLIPEGVAGWVRIEYEVADASPLPQEGGRYVVAIPKSSFLQTSSKPDSGFGDDQYFYIDERGGRTPLPIDQGDPNVAAVRDRKTFTIGAPGTPNRTFRAFFVGKESAYQNAPKDPTTLPLP
jgi:hypothetical protein